MCSRPTTEASRLSPSGPATVAVSISVHGFIGGAFLHEDHDVVLPGGNATLRSLFDHCRDTLELDVWKVLDMNERLRHNVMVNGARRAVPDDMDAPLPDGAQVALLSPMAGG